MRVLGLSAFQRQSAAALVVRGVAVAAVREEHFTRVLLDSAFPTHALRWVLAQAGARGSELDGVVFYEKPLRRFERVLVRTLETFPSAPRAFVRTAFAWLGERLWLRSQIAAELELAPQRVLFVDQARAHMALALHASGCEHAALLHLDDAGEWSTCTLARGDAGVLELLAEVRHPHSLGGLASAFTQFVGLVAGEDESRLEALAACGRPRFAAELARLCPERDGAFVLEPGFFTLDDGAARLYTPALEALVGPARAPGQPLRWQAPDAHDADLAASVQALLEERALALAHELHRRTELACVCVSGQLASNRRLLARLAAQGPFERVCVAPDPGKAGAALGAALYGYRVLAGSAPAPSGFALGPALGASGEPGALAWASPAELRAELARRLLAGELVGWVRGPLEFAERSLSSRLALALARGPDARARLLAALQHFEPYLPARLALPAERAAEFFEFDARSTALLEQAQLSVPAREALRRVAPDALAADGHAWPQLVDARRDPELGDLLARLGAAGAEPLLFVTDLALRGAPLVRTERDALELFERSRLDVLAAGPRTYVH
ncbi:MAG: hypothetical protein EXS08_00225 [Planctomycetes bacterium]|nr:hypothetical protein [Planctomycetota bacterium]